MADDQNKPAGDDGSVDPEREVDAAELPGEYLASDDLHPREDAEIVGPEPEELANASTEKDDTPDEGNPEDVVIDNPSELSAAEAAAARARSSRPVRRSDQTATSKASAEAKGRKTRSRDEAEKDRAEQSSQRTTPVEFTRESVDELRKVVWPTRDQLFQYFVVVLVLVLVVIAYVGLLDTGFGWALLKLFGQK